MSANGETLPEGTSEVADVKGKGKGVQQPEMTMEDEEEDEESGEEEEEVSRETLGYGIAVADNFFSHSKPNLKKVTTLLPASNPH